MTKDVVCPNLLTEQDAFVPQFFPQYLVLCTQVLDGFLLLEVDPTGEDHQIQLPRVKQEAHGQAVGSMQT